MSRKSKNELVNEEFIISNKNKFDENYKLLCELGNDFHMIFFTESYMRISDFLKESVDKNEKVSFSEGIIFKTIKRKNYIKSKEELCLLKSLPTDYFVQIVPKNSVIKVYECAFPAHITLTQKAEALITEMNYNFYYNFFEELCDDRLQIRFLSKKKYSLEKVKEFTETGVYPSDLITCKLNVHLNHLEFAVKDNDFFEKAKLILDQMEINATDKNEIDEFVKQFIINRIKN